MVTRLAKSCPSAIEEEAATAPDAALSDDYNVEMQAKMGTSLAYRHENGMNYNRITPDIIVGSCPQRPEDIDTLVKAGVTVVVCLQRDSDMAYFNLDVAPIIARCSELGSIRHLRLGIHDFDPFNLRLRLPDVIRDVASAHKELGGTIYVHCTAGMGRAPAVALAYMWWAQGIPLDDAWDTLRSRRQCSPKLYAIRQAAADILYGGETKPVTITKHGSSLSSKVEIAGLDNGWYNRIPLQRVGPGDDWVVERNLLPGIYPYKFVMDEVWSYDADKATIDDGGNINNYEEVFPAGLSKEQLRSRERVLAEGGVLTPDELEQLRRFVCGA